MPMFQDMNKEVYWMSFRDETVFFNLALLNLSNFCNAYLNELIVTQKVYFIKIFAVLLLFEAYNMVASKIWEDSGDINSVTVTMDNFN